jgi:hypothetical protein
MLSDQYIKEKLLPDMAQVTFARLRMDHRYLLIIQDPTAWTQWRLLAGLPVNVVGDRAGHGHPLRYRGIYGVTTTDDDPEGVDEGWETVLVDAGLAEACDGSEITVANVWACALGEVILRLQALDD